MVADALSKIPHIEAVISVKNTLRDRIKDQLGRDQWYL